MREKERERWWMSICHRKHRSNKERNEGASSCGGETERSVEKGEEENKKEKRRREEKTQRHDGSP